jgi:hypothetical protein
VRRDRPATWPGEVTVRIELTEDQALVLSDWLDRVMHREAFAALVEDRARLIAGLGEFGDATAKPWGGSE